VSPKKGPKCKLTDLKDRVEKGIWNVENTIASSIHKLKLEEEYLVKEFDDLVWQTIKWGSIVTCMVVSQLMFFYRMYEGFNDQGFME